MQNIESQGRGTDARAFIARLLRTHTLPAFLIIGAQKGGTTSLASYLACHPYVVAPLCKEVHFFDIHYSKGASWYREHFPIGARRRIQSGLIHRRIVGCDATPYYLLHPQAPARARQLIPSARIIILLRDPVARAYSHYHHAVRLGIESLPFTEAIDSESSRTLGEAQRLKSEPYYESHMYQHFTYLERGAYWNQIARWLTYFHPSQFLVLSSEEFFGNPAANYRKVLQFLSLPAWELPAYPAEHVGKYPPMQETTRRRLVEYFAPFNHTLRQQLNQRWPGTGDVVVDRFVA